MAGQGRAVAGDGAPNPPAPAAAGSRKSSAQWSAPAWQRRQDRLGDSGVALGRRQLAVDGHLAGGRTGSGTKLCVGPGVNGGRKLGASSAQSIPSPEHTGVWLALAGGKKGVGWRWLALVGAGAGWCWLALAGVKMEVVGVKLASVGGNKHLLTPLMSGRPGAAGLQVRRGRPERRTSPTKRT